MFQELIELLKRYVIAHERLAQANEVIAQAAAAKLIRESASPECCVEDVVPGQPDGTECTAGQPMTQTPPTTLPAQQPPAEEPATGWNPYTSPVMKQYKGEKQGILKAELAKFGIDPGAKMTGAQMHELLLDKAKQAQAAPAAPVAPDAPVAPAAPVAPMAPAGPSAPVLTMPGVPAAPAAPVNAAPAPAGFNYEMVKQAVYDLYNRGPAGQAEALRLLQEIGGSTQLADPETQTPKVPQEKWLLLYNAAIEAKGRV